MYYAIRDEYYLSLEYGEPALRDEPESLGEPVQSRSRQTTDKGVGQFDRHWGTDPPLRLLFPEYILLCLPSRSGYHPSPLHGKEWKTMRELNKKTLTPYK